MSKTDWLRRQLDHAAAMSQDRPDWMRGAARTILTYEGMRRQPMPTNPRSKSQERRLAVQRDPTPETCRELADKLERYCENMTPAEWVVSGSHWLEAFIHRVVGPWIDGKSKTGINGEEVEYVAEKMKMERCDASFAADCRNNAESIITALRGYADAAGKIERLTALCESMANALVSNDSFGVPGSDFSTCEACKGGGSPYVPFSHSEDCPVGKVEREADDWHEENARLSAAAGERWIPVSERLPELCRDVIVHFQSLGSTTQAFRCQTGVWKDSGGVLLVGHLITHWQPLPEPPVGSKESEQPNG